MDLLSGKEKQGSPATAQHFQHNIYKMKMQSYLVLTEDILCSAPRNRNLLVGFAILHFSGLRGIL